MGTKLGDIVRPSNFILIFVGALLKWSLFMGNDILQPPPIGVILAVNFLCTITHVHVQSKWR